MFFKRSLWLLGSLSVLAVVRVVTAESAWREMRATGSRMEAIVANRETTRPILHGEPIQGLAFDEYSRAEELLAESALDDWILFFRARHNGDPAADELRDALIDEHREMLAALGRGARSTDARFPITWSDNFSLELPRLMETRTVVNISLLAAERHIEQGRPDLAVETLLSAMQFARDLSQSPFLINEMVGFSLLVIASKEGLIDDELVDCLPTHELARLAQAMSVLDSTLSPTSQAWEGELAAFARRAAGPQTADGTDGEWFEFGMRTPSLGALWYGFSTRAMMAHNIEDADQFLSRMGEAEGDSWLERKELHESLQSDPANSETVLRDRFSAIWSGAETTRRDCIASFRLARFAVEYRATGESLVLPDPYGTGLLVTANGETLRVRSAGRGVDRNPNHLAIELSVR